MQLSALMTDALGRQPRRAKPLRSLKSCPQDGDAGEGEAPAPETRRNAPDPRVGAQLPGRGGSGRRLMVGAARARRALPRLPPEARPGSATARGEPGRRCRGSGSRSLAGGGAAARPPRGPRAESPEGSGSLPRRGWQLCEAPGRPSAPPLPSAPVRGQGRVPTAAAAALLKGLGAPLGLMPAPQRAPSHVAPRVPPGARTGYYILGWFRPKPAAFPGCRGV